jgi:hypothetical protein
VSLFTTVGLRKFQSFCFKVLWQRPNLNLVGAPLPRRTAVRQHRRHQISISLTNNEPVFDDNLVPASPGWDTTSFTDGEPKTKPARRARAERD